MNWGEISGLCHEELEKLQADTMLSSVWRSIKRGSQALLELEQETDENVGFAVRTFADTRAWPELSDRERAMLLFRLDFAAGLADLLYQQPKPWIDVETAEDDEMRISWLMLFAWEQFGFDFLHQAFAKLCAADLEQD